MSKNNGVDHNIQGEKTAVIKKIKILMEELKPFNTADVVFYGIITLFCYFVFQHPDILHTGRSSYTVFRGHIFDFYDENAKFVHGSNYLISTYILYAIWNAPLYIFKIIKNPYIDAGYVVFWYKALPALFFAASAFVMYKIGRITGLSSKYSKLLVVFWVSSPLLFFSQFIFGQYDIFTVFFMLLGIYHYLKKNTGLFVLFFGISMTFKYFPFFIFVPLLLLNEKRPLYIVRNMFLLLVPVILEILPYINSAPFKTYVLGFDALQRTYSAGLRLEYDVNISLLVVGWFFMSALAYWKEAVNREEFIQWAFYFSMFSSSYLFAVMLWHPQWLIFATPFLVLTTIMYRRARFFIYLDLVMMLFFVLFTVNFWRGGVDQSLLSLGIFRGVHPYLSDPLATVFMKDLFVFENRSIYFSAVTACFMLNIILKFPGMPFTGRRADYFFDEIKNERNTMRARFFIGILIFIVPAMASLALSLPNKTIYNTAPVKKPGVPFYNKSVSGSSVGQVFRAKTPEIYALAVKMRGYEAKTGTGPDFGIFEYNAEGNKGRPVLRGRLDGSKIHDKNYFLINMSDAEVTPGKTYIFSFYTTGGKENGHVSVYRTPEKEKNNDTFAVIDGESCNFDLVFRMYGRK